MKFWIVFIIVVSVFASQGNRQVSTIITGLWNIKRGELQSSMKRSFEYYLDHFKVLLQTEANLIIFGTKQLKLFVEEHRKRPNYVFIVRELEWFENKWHNALIERVRKNYEETLQDWVFMKVAPQYGLYLYNAVVMAKLFLMRQALDYDIWNSDFFLWQDGGINHSFYDVALDEPVISPQNIIEQITYLMSWPVNMQSYQLRKLEQQPYVIANYFNLYIESVTDFAGAYENYLRITLEEYYMNTEERVLTSMYFRLPYLVPKMIYIPGRMLNHHFEVNSYYRQRISAMRRFNFGRDFERVAEEIQQEKQLWSPSKQDTANAELQAHQCSLSKKIWLLFHNLPYKKSRAFKHTGLFGLMLLLFLKVKIQR